MGGKEKLTEGPADEKVQKVVTKGIQKTKKRDNHKKTAVLSRKTGEK